MKGSCLLTVLLVACTSGMPGGTSPKSIPHGTEVSQIPQPATEPVPLPPPVPSSSKTTYTTDTASQISTRTIESAQSTAANVMTTAEITQLQTSQLDAAFAQLQSFGDSRAFSLPESRVPIFGPSVDKSDAVATVSTLQAEILKTFSGPQYAGMRDQLTQALGQGWTSRLPVQQAPPVFGNVEVVRRNDLADVLRQLLGIVRGITRRPENRVSISIHTQPQQATFTLCPQYLTDGCYSITTDGDVPDIFRGLYTYTIQLAGYKTAQFNIDLVHFSQQQLKCTLHPNASTSLISPCTPQ